MRSCDKRLEIRLPSEEKAAAEHAADKRGITVSELIRRSLRNHLGMQEPLSLEDRITVAALRRRINTIEARFGRSDDLAQARADAQMMLDR
ncbi:MAG TPA: ribbon-helix-helix protein, CopG family [Tianweitania sediminis]|nr:ribbon-helix-helix protein, CopG family [Tianweitania sediminis]